MKNLIYRVYCKTSQKSYIGLTTMGLPSRKNRHLSNYKNNNIKETKFYRAISKYGEEDFEWSVLEYCEESLLFDREIYWIEIFNSYKKGYNSTLGGEGCKNPLNNITKSLYNEDLGIISGTYEQLSNITKINEASIRTFFKESRKDLKSLFKTWVKIEDNDLFREYTGYAEWVNKERDEYYKGNLISFCEIYKLNQIGLNKVLRKERKSYEGWIVL